MPVATGMPAAGDRPQGRPPAPGALLGEAELDEDLADAGLLLGEEGREGLRVLVHVDPAALGRERVPGIGLHHVADGGVDIPTFKELGYDVELVNWRGLLTKAGLDEEGRAALDATIGDMVKSDAWHALAKERGWVDMYQDPPAFAAFLAEEQTRIGQILVELGLSQE